MLQQSLVTYNQPTLHTNHTIRTLYTLYTLYTSYAVHILCVEKQQCLYAEDTEDAVDVYAVR